MRAYVVAYRAQARRAVEVGVRTPGSPSPGCREGAILPPSDHALTNFFGVNLGLSSTHPVASSSRFLPEAEGRAGAIGSTSASTPGCATAHGRPHVQVEAFMN